MSNRLTGIAILFITCAVISKAGTVDVTSDQKISVPQGATVEFGFNISNFARASGSDNPYPTSLSFQVLGQAGAGQLSAALPGSSQQYDPEFLLDAELTSADGSASVPLLNSAATRLGLTRGSMVVTSGVLQGSQATNVNLINASVQLTPQQSALLFGANIASASDVAYVVLHNDGPAIVLGIGGGCDMRSAMVVSGVSGSRVSTGGITQQVAFTGVAVSTAPEPGTYANLAGALLLLLFFRGYAAINRAQVKRI